MNKPLISVIITAYNRTKYLEHALMSAVAQDVDPLLYEIIIVTNLDIRKPAERKGSPNVYVVKSEMVGQGPFILDGIDRCQGDYLLFLDDDDLFLPTKLQRVVKLIKEFPNVGFYHNGHLLTTNGSDGVARKVEGAQLTSNKRVTVKSMANWEHYRKRVAGIYRLKPDFNSSSIMIKKSIICQNRSYMAEQDYLIDGFLFYISLTSHRHIVVDDMKLTQYRLHDGNRTQFLEREGNQASMRRITEEHIVAAQKIRKMILSKDDPVALELIDKFMNYLLLIQKVQSHNSKRKQAFAPLMRLIRDLFHFRSNKDFGLLIIMLIFVFYPRLSHRIYLRVRNLFPTV